jgi:hypothetical protein
MQYKMTILITDDCDPEPVPLSCIIEMVEAAADLAGIDIKVENTELVPE